MSKIDIKSLAVGALAAAVAGLGFAAVNRNDDALVSRINAEVRNAVAQGIRDNPKLLVDTIQGYMRAEQERQVKERDNALVSKRAEIARTDDHPIVGNPKGTIEIVYFFDANCGYCKRMDPALKKVVAENPDVKVIHKEIPILGESSRLAAQISNLVWQSYPARYQELHDRFLAHNGALTADQIEDYLRLTLSAEEAQAILFRAANKDSDAVAVANARIQGNLKLAEEAGITGTPFVYIVQGDGILRGAGEKVYDDVSGLVAKARNAVK